jgi:hypothetical protein
MRGGILIVVSAILVVPAAASAADAGGATADALNLALAKNTAQAREWLEQKDFKSLAQSASSLLLFAELLKARSDDADWQLAYGRLLNNVEQLQAAARDEDALKCKYALHTLGLAAETAGNLKPTGKPQALARAPAIRSLMLTMDAVLGGAKVAVLTGNVEAAKKQARVLAELGRLVSNSRSTDGWSSLAGDFVTAASSAADSTESDAKVVRQQLRAVAERCEACHEKSRMR